nr:nuclear pore complex protein NUP98A-like isoform X3 [Lolium perenne]
MGSSSSWSTPAFGSSCSTTAFGSSYSTPAFGSSCPTPAFGPPFTTPAFGLMSPNPAFGLSPSGPFDSFGSSWSTQAVGQHPNIFRTPMPHQHAPFPPTPFGATIGQHSSSVPGFTMSSTPPFGVPSMPSPFVSLPSPFGSFDRVSEKGSRVSAYSKTADGETPFYFQSISAMPVYNSKSHEELRHEDYQRGDKGNPSLPKSMVPSANHPWQPQPPVQLLEDLSEAHVKPSVVPQSTTQGFGCNTNNPFWLRSVGPQPPVFSFPPSSSAPATSRENIFSNTASYRAPDTSFTQGGSLLSSSVSHSAPAPSPNGQCTSINIDHSKKAVELLLPIDITTVRIRFYPRNDDTGSLASQVHNVRASPTPVSFSIYPGENQDLTIRSVEQPASQTGKTSSSTGPAGEQKGNISDVPLTDRSPFGAPGCEVISESVLPRLYKADYYTLPSIAELAARECQEPGSCSHVKDFTVGRHGYGSVKFEGETDVRMLDITSIVEFKDREINAYMDESKRPPVGQELNKPAEITLLNVKCVDQKTGLQLMEGPAVDAYKEVLAQWTKSHDAEFISFDPVKGEWKFSVKKL